MGTIKTMVPTVIIALVLITAPVGTTDTIIIRTITAGMVSTIIPTIMP